MIDLVAAAKSVNTIANTVEGGSLESTLAELGLDAAKDALGSVPYTNDKRSQVWSAVNHLQAADTALRSAIQKRGRRLHLTNPGGLVVAIIQRRYILGLIAICYRYLGEKAMADKTVSMIPSADDGWDKWVNFDEEAFRNASSGVKLLRQTLGFVQIPIPTVQIGEYKRVKMAILQYRYDAPTFSRNLNASWRAGPRDLLSFREYGLPEA